MVEFDCIHCHRYQSRIVVIGVRMGFSTTTQAREFRAVAQEAAWYCGPSCLLPGGVVPLGPLFTLLASDGAPRSGPSGREVASGTQVPNKALRPMYGSVGAPHQYQRMWPIRA